MQEEKDREIIERLSKDPRKAFELIVGAYSRRVYWHVRRMLGDHEDSNDVVQNVFIKVWENLGNFRGDSHIYTWIYRIASNEALNQLAMRKRKATLSISDHEEELVNRGWSGNDPGGAEISKKLEAAIETLPDKQRLVFNLKYFEDMKYEDIAEVTETSVGALKASYHHAVKKIENLLNGD